MMETFVDDLQVVVATKGRDRQYWVAVTTRKKAATVVQKSLAAAGLKVVFARPPFEDHLIFRPQAITLLPKFFCITKIVGDLV